MGRFLKKTDIILVLFCSALGFVLGGSSDFENKITSEKKNSPSNSLVSKSHPSFSHVRSSDKVYSFYENDLLGGRTKKVNRIVAQLLKGNISENWEEYLQAIIEDSFSSEGSQDALLILFSRWAEKDFEQAFEAAARTNLRIVRKELILQFADTSPKEALEYYMNNRGIIGGDLYLLIDIASRSWARQNPMEALDWCLSSLTRARHGIALTNIFEEVGYCSSQSRELLNRIYEQSGKIPLNIITLWAQNDPDSAREWVYTQGSDMEKQAFMTGLLTREPQKVIEMLAELPAEKQSRYISDIIFKTEDKEAGFSCLLALKPISQITEADLSSLRWWANKNPDEAQQWVRQLPTSEAKNIAVQFYVDGLVAKSGNAIWAGVINLSEENPFETALPLVNDMDNEDRKAQAKELLFQKWEAWDARSLEEWRTKTATQ